MTLTRRQALFVKYLVTRFDYNYFTHGPVPKNMFDEVINKDPGTSFRNTALYFYARYPEHSSLSEGTEFQNNLKELEGRWWKANELSGQIMGCILIEEAKKVLGRHHSKTIKNTNW